MYRVWERLLKHCLLWIDMLWADTGSAFFVFGRWRGGWATLVDVDGLIWRKIKGMGGFKWMED